MFSFHKPKVYRSSAGCCICKAKSSSSRFTDSKKYEDDFMECFQLRERRSGEICNACVLLVKRWKKLPTGSERNWNHVVDARAGPGTKSLTKFKAKNKKKKLKADAKKAEGSIKKKHVYLKGGDGERSHSPDAYSDDINGEDMSEDFSMPPSLAPSPTPSEDGDGEIPLVKKRRHRSRSPQRKSGAKRWPSPEFSTFLDLKLWKREEVCCGIVFKGPNAAVVIDLNYWKPCGDARRHRTKESSTTPSTTSPSKAPSTTSPQPHKQKQAEEEPKEQESKQQDAALPLPLPLPLPPQVISTSTEASPAASPQHHLLLAPMAPLAPLAAPVAPLDTSMKVIAVAARTEGVATNGVGVVTKTFSDSSSDSGYDESSNQGVESREAATALEFANRSHMQPVEIRAD